MGSTICLLAGDYGGTNIVAISRDNGLTWSLQTLPLTSDWQDISASSTKLCALAISGPVAVLTPDITASISQADIDDFNKAHAGDGITAGFGEPIPLAGGSLLETASAPKPFSSAGSLNELTAPPLPFSSGGSYTERTSSVTLPLADLATGGSLQHIGLPFTLGG
jgi:hypothetical protein